MGRRIQVTSILKSEAEPNKMAKSVPPARNVWGLADPFALVRDSARCPWMQRRRCL